MEAAAEDRAGWSGSALLGDKEKVKQDKSLLRVCRLQYR